MRILMFCQYFPPQYSGAAKQGILLAKKLHLLGHEIEFITVRSSGTGQMDLVEGFTVHRIKCEGKRYQELSLWKNFFFFAFKNRHRFDILHSHGANYLNSMVGLLSKFMGWKSLVKATMAQGDLKGLGVSRSGMLHYLFLKMVNAYVGISQDLVKEFEEQGFRQDRIYHIPNGVDLLRFRVAGKAEKEDLRKEMNLPLNRPIILSVGVFDHRKNIGWLIKEWARSRGCGTDAFLLAVGPRSREDRGGQFLASLKKLEKEQPERLRVVNYVDNIAQCFRAANLFVLPSINEGLPNVILEAMASGLPCIGARTSGTRELIIDGVNGFSFKPEDGEDFSKKMNLVLKENWIEQMGKQARGIVEKRFSIELVAKQYDRLYREIMRN